LLAADADKHKRIHLVQGAAKIEGQVSRFDRKSHPALSRDHETHSWLLDDSYLGLHGLLNNDCLRLHGLLNHSNLGLHGLCVNDSNSAAHVKELGAEFEPASRVDVDLLHASVGATCCEHTEGHVSLSDHSVTLIFDDDVHLVLEHVCSNLHPLALPVRGLSAVVAGLGVPLLLSDCDVDEGGHLVQGTANLVVQFCLHYVNSEYA
jgi:hypothetical protein